MKASIFALSLLLSVAARAADSGDGTGPAPASIETPASPHTEAVKKHSSSCLGTLCAEDVSSFTNDHVTVTIEGLSSRN
jgi:hypothetical protein